MNNRRLRSRHASARPSPACRERGVVMFIALLVMVALSLAGIALIRSADTATVVSGNLAFKQAAVYAVDRSVEQAIAALFEARRPRRSTDKTADLPAQNYYACVRRRGGRLPACQHRRFRRFRSMLTTEEPMPPRSLTDGLIRRGRRGQQELLRDRAHVRQRGVPRWAATAICPAPRWAPTRERNITGSCPSRRCLLPRHGSRRGSTQYGRLCAGDTSVARGIPGLARSSTHDIAPSVRIQEILRRRRCRGATLQPLGAYAAPIGSQLAEIPLQGSIPSSRTSCSRWTTRRVCRGISCRTISGGLFLTARPGAARRRDG